MNPQAPLRVPRADTTASTVMHGIRSVALPRPRTSQEVAHIHGGDDDAKAQIESVEEGQPRRSDPEHASGSRKGVEAEPQRRGEGAEEIEDPEAADQARDEDNEARTRAKAPQGAPQQARSKPDEEDSDEQEHQRLPGPEAPRHHGGEGGVRVDQHGEGEDDEARSAHQASPRS